MKISAKLVAILLLASGTVCSETIAEAEKSLLKEAESYKNHPLYMYLKPEGGKALDQALRGFPTSCLDDKAIETDNCKRQRLVLVTKLTDKYNFTDVSTNDFKDKELWALYESLKNLQQAKINELNQQMQSLKLKDRLPLMGMIKDLHQKEKVLTEHLKKSRKPSKANRSGKNTPFE